MNFYQGKFDLHEILNYRDAKSDEFSEIGEHFSDTGMTRPPPCPSPAFAKLSSRPTLGYPRCLLTT